jgi:ribA/ribD-fused uncharacterized protein
MAIKEFIGEYRFLSNFYLAEVILDGEIYRSVEHAYVAAKTLDLEKRKEIANIIEPKNAKRLGRKLKLRENWPIIKTTIMETLVRRKFEQEPLRSMLLSTGDEELIEGNWWGDRFWGVCNGVGENKLGKILMKIREELRNST